MRSLLIWLSVTICVCRLWVTQLVFGQSSWAGNPNCRQKGNIIVVRQSFLAGDSRQCSGRCFDSTAMADYSSWRALQLQYTSHCRNCRCNIPLVFPGYVRAARQESYAVSAPMARNLHLVHCSAYGKKMPASARTGFGTEAHWNRPVIDRFAHNYDRFKNELQKNAHNPGEVRFLRSIVRPAMQVMQIGAKTAAPVIAIAKAIGDSGHLYAFEPAREHYMMLMAYLSQKELTNVSAYNLAVTNHTGRTLFYMGEGRTSSIIPAMGGDTVWVEAITITDFLIVQEISKIDLLNIDCAGSELFVLEGAQAVLAKHAPQVLFELHHTYLAELGQSADELISYLTHLGYSVRLLQLDDPRAGVRPGTCSHVYATKTATVPADSQQGEHR